MASGPAVEELLARFRPDDPGRLAAKSLCFRCVALERDLVRLMSSYGPEALDRSLDEVMTKSPVTCDSNMAVIGALSQMTQKRIRHLPVVDGGRLVGFVSIGDLVKYRIDHIEAEAAAMRDYIAS